MIKRLNRFQCRICVLVPLTVPVAWHWRDFNSISLDLRFFYAFITAAFVVLAGAVDFLNERLRQVSRSDEPRTSTISEAEQSHGADSDNADPVLHA